MQNQSRRGVLFMAKSSNIPNRSKVLVRRETRSAYLFLLPNMIFFVGFVIIPMILCIYTSFFDSTMGKNAKDVFIGFQNYIELWKDPIFLRALKNTFVIVLVSVPVVCIFSLWVPALDTPQRREHHPVISDLHYRPETTSTDRLHRHLQSAVRQIGRAHV